MAKVEKLEAGAGAGAKSPVGRGKAGQTYAKNEEQLARAFGLNLAPRKRKASMAIVMGWTKQLGFPAKHGNKGWKLLEVQQWREGAARTGPEGAERPKESDLPAQAQPAGDGELFMAPGEALKGRLDLLEEMYLHPQRFETKIAKFEIDELRRYRPQIWGTDDTAGLGARGAGREGAAQPGPEGAGDRAIGPTLQENRVTGGEPGVGAEALGGGLGMVGSQKELAVRLARHFRGKLVIDVSEQQVSNWKRGENLPDGAPLPPAREGNRIDADEWAAWVERFVVPRYGVQTNAQGALIKDVFTLGQEAEARKKMWEEKIKEAEYWATSDKYIEVARAERLGAAWARRYHDFWKDRNEKVDPGALEQQALNLGVPAPVAAELTAWLVQRCQAFLDLVEVKCMEATQEWDAELKKKGD